jgi:iron complex outermembrane receptor protein
MIHPVNHFKSLLLFFSLLMLPVQSTYSQTAGTISGIVKDAGGNVLAGATVQIERTNKGGYTNAQGRFSLEAIPGNYTVLVSFVGYVTQHQPVTVKAGEAAVLISQYKIP